MAMVGDTSPKSIDKGIKDLKSAQASFDKSHKAYLAGRTIKKAEDELSEKIRVATEKSAALEALAKDRVLEIELALEEADAITKAAKLLMAQADTKAKDVAVEAKKVNDAQAEVLAMADTASIKAQNAEKVKARYQEKINQINVLLSKVADI